jgi:sterol desaturase/sphingolipid hydroxylase (fatty acid hydroxylase superfamily)
VRAAPLLGALLAILLALGSLALAARLHRAEPGREPQPPHPVLSTIGAGLLSGFVLLTGFLVATGWAARITHNDPPGGLYVAALLAGVAVLLYPALADLPFTWRHTTAVALLAAMVGGTFVLALQLRR